MTSLRIDLQPLAGPGPSTAPPKRRRRWRLRLLVALALVPAALLIPPVLLLRGGVELYVRGWGVGPALAGGAGAALLTLALVGTGAAAALGLRGGFRRLLVRIAIWVAAGWIVWGLTFVATSNVKGDEVAAEYRELHPLLRLASATLILVDRRTVLTDASRTVEDYSAMGLPPNEASLHFRQSDGWVHALDLRTRDRPEWRNRAVALAFEAMGFRTLRHVGTADHLHVSIPARP